MPRSSEYHFDIGKLQPVKFLFNKPGTQLLFKSRRWNLRNLDLLFDVRILPLLDNVQRLANIGTRQQIVLRQQYRATRKKDRCRDPANIISTSASCSR